MDLTYPKLPTQVTNSPLPSCSDLSKVESEWDDYRTAVTDLRETNLPVFAHKLGTLLSKDIVLLHQIIKKDNPGWCRMGIT